MHFFKTANEQMSIFHLLENRKLRYTLRSGPLKDGDMLRSLKEIGIEENNDKITFHHYDDVYSFLFKNLPNLLHVPIIAIIFQTKIILFFFGK